MNLYKIEYEELGYDKDCLVRAEDKKESMLKFLTQFKRTDIDKVSTCFISKADNIIE